MNDERQALFIIYRSSFIIYRGNMFSIKKSIQQTNLLQGFCDIHSHLLYGVDDGSGSPEESLQALEGLEKQGIKTLWLTPHIMEDVPNSTDALKNRYNELSALYKGPIHLHLAAEYMLDNLFEQRWQTNDLLPLANQYLLVETSCLTPPLGFDSLLFDIRNGKYRPLLAHPERYLYMQPSDYEKYKKRGISFQLNLLSLAGSYGKEACRKARYLLHKGWYDLVGTDIHHPELFERAIAQKCLSSADLRRLQQLALNNRSLAAG